MVVAGSSAMTPGNRVGNQNNPKPVRLSLRRMRLGLYTLSFLALAVSFVLMILLDQPEVGQTTQTPFENTVPEELLHPPGMEKDPAAGKGGEFTKETAVKVTTQNEKSEIVNADETNADDLKVVSDAVDKAEVMAGELNARRLPNNDVVVKGDESTVKSKATSVQHQTNTVKEDSATKEAEKSLSDMIGALKKEKTDLEASEKKAVAQKDSNVPPETTQEGALSETQEQEKTDEKDAKEPAKQESNEQSEIVQEDSPDKNEKVPNTGSAEAPVDTTKAEETNNTDETNVEIPKKKEDPSPEGASDTQEKGVVAESKQPVQFILVADTRSGSEWILNALDQHPAVCASGLHDNDKLGFPTGALLPEIMSWVPDNDLTKGCTIAFVRDSVIDLLKSSSVEGDQKKWTVPDRCVSTYDSSTDPIAVHLLRFCKIVEIIQGRVDSFDEEKIKHAVTEIFMDSFSRDTDLLPCTCPPSTTAQGLKVMADWVFRLHGLLDGEHNVKVVRLHRENVFARYMSLALSLKTGIWQTPTLTDKLKQLEAVPNDWEIDVDDMLHQFGYMNQQDIEGNQWSEEHANGGKENGVLNIDYGDCVENMATCFQKIFTFLEIDNVDAYVGEHPDQFKTTFKGASETPLLLNRIANSDIVHEALGASCRWVSHVPDYNEIEHLQIFDEETSSGEIIRSPEKKGIKTKVLFNKKDHTHKFEAAVSALKEMGDDTLVVVSMNSHDDPVTLNHHIRSQTKRFSAMVQFRKVLRTLTVNGAVVASTGPACCVSALTHASPGDFFESASVPAKRKNRACTSGTADCTWNGDEAASTWQSFMKLVAKNADESASIYLDAKVLAGKASDMLKLLEAVDIGQMEDERAVLTDYMYHYPDSLILDYKADLFGQRFEGTTYKGHAGCSTDNDESAQKDPSLSVKIDETMPLYMYNPSDLGCTDEDPSMMNAAVQHFPQWSSDGVKMNAIIDHIDNVLIRNQTMPGIDLHFEQEILYVVDRDGVWTSRKERDRYRVKPTDNLLLVAYQILMEEKNPRWAALQSAMDQGGLPYFAWYGDFKDCGSDTVPLFTTCAVASCNHGFPSPAYMTIIDAQEDIGKWYNTFRGYERDYPFDSKIRKVAWRGALSENNPTKVYSSVRWRLCELVARREEGAADIFDVGMTYIPDYISAQLGDIDVSKVGGLKAGLNPMPAFQQYRAVLDMDGNSWSSRFGTLLCYNSVTIKVEPAYVDYFYYDLVPWKHYIPVKDDLSDLEANVAFAMDPDNDRVVQEMIASANQWCAERFVTSELARDQLDLWNDYVRMLNVGAADENGWMAAWNEKKSKLFEANNPYNLVRVEYG